MFTYSKNPQGLKNKANSTLPVLCKWSNKAQTTMYLLTTQFTEYSKPTVETNSSEKKIPFKILLFSDNATGHARALTEMYNEINVV